MEKREYRIIVLTKILDILGEVNPKRERLCEKCFNKKMTIENAVSFIILNS